MRSDPQPPGTADVVPGQPEEAPWRRADPQPPPRTGPAPARLGRMVPAPFRRVRPRRPDIPATAGRSAVAHPRRCPITTVVARPEYPFRRDMQCPFDPAPDFAELRREQPATRVRLWDGSWAWL